MRITIIHIIIGVFLFAAVSSAQSGTSVKKEKAVRNSDAAAVRRAEIENKIIIFERASANRELAAITQIEQARTLENQAVDFTKNNTADDLDSTNIHKKTGAAENSAAKMYGAAASNFDKAAANRQQVVVLSSSLGNMEKKRNAQAYAANLKIQADEAIRLASTACERASEAYDKAGDQVNVAAASQQAAVWLEKLAAR